jgi:predicted esterase
LEFKFKLKKMDKINFFRKVLFTVAVIFAMTEIQAQDGITGRATPDYHHVAYDTGPNNILNIYIAEGTRNGPPTPLYVWAHGGGGTLDGFANEIWSELKGAGISAISWGSVDNIFLNIVDFQQAMKDKEKGLIDNIFPNLAGFHQAMKDMEKVMEFVLENADKYNFDTNKIVTGGSSRGSFISWEYAHNNPKIVKGIYSSGALGDPLMWKEYGWEPRNAIHAGSPPLYFTYLPTPGDGNIHNPKSGTLIKERYEELGIGHLARMEHSLTKRGLHRWSFLAEFIKEVTSQ